MKNRENKLKRTHKMAAFSPMISIGTLYLNCLNTPAKTQRFAKWMYKKMNRTKQNQPKKIQTKKTDPTIRCL